MIAPIPFVDLDAQRRRLGDRIEKAISRVIDQGKFILGPEVHELEERLADYCGARHAVTCASGTDALLLPLLAWGIGPGDAVFVPDFSFAATAEVVALLGATPVFVDVLPNTFNLDPAALAGAIEAAAAGGLRPVGVMPVDLFGQPADYEPIEKVAAQSGLWVLADAAQSFGAVYRGRRVGTIGAATATSFFPAKPLGCYGDGGAVFTEDDALADVMRSLRVHGQGAHKYDVVRVGINGRLDTIQAAVLLEKLDIFDDELLARQAIAERYTSGLERVAKVPTVLDGVTSAWAQYTVRLPDRDAVAESLKGAGIPTAVYYPKPLHSQAAYQSYPCPGQGAAATAAAVLSLPMHPYLEPDVQDRILRCTTDSIAAAR